MSALRALLAGIVDYAGLYPPAGLSMRAAVEEYALRLGSPEAWMLGRFVVGASRLGELAQAAAPYLPKEGTGAAWRVTALLGEDAVGDLTAVARFNEGEAGRAVVDTVEGKASRPEDVDRLITAVPGGLVLYVEVPLDPDPTPLLAVLATRGARAKVRTGGLTAAAVPSPASLARFLATCASLSVPFKATAGLHHPVRSERLLTGAPDSPRALMHGFLNVFAAAALLRAGLTDEAGAAAVIAEERGGAFVFEEGTLRVGRQSLDAQELTDARCAFATSFGSCSFAEPIEDLRGLGLFRTPALSS